MIDWHITFLVLSMVAILPVAICLIIQEYGLYVVALAAIAWGLAISSAMVK